MYEMSPASPHEQCKYPPQRQDDLESHEPLERRGSPTPGNPEITVTAYYPNAELQDVVSLGWPTSLKREDSSDTRSTTVRDYGMGKQMKQERREEELHSAQSTETRHAGAGFSSSSDVTPAAFNIDDELSQDTDSIDSTPTHDSDEDSSLDPDTDKIQDEDQVEEQNSTPAGRLEEELWNALKTARTFNNEIENKFVSVSDEKRIVTEASVKSVLTSLRSPSQARLVPDDKVESFMKKIIEPTKVGSKNPTSRRKIFAILCLLEETSAILDFIREDIYDEDLPLRYVGDREKHVVTKSSKNIPFIKNWKHVLRRSFLKYQWGFLAPFFDLPSPDKICHYDLAWQAILPFMSASHQPDKAKPEGIGGFADVWRVKIHPSHIVTESDEELEVAVKRLREQDEESFRAEVRALKQISKQNDPYLTPLLFTFKHRDYYHLVFRWAHGGNLQDLWKSHPEPTNPPRDRDLAIQFVTHLLGLAKGLQTIHDCPDPNAKSYGIHGDIKPENILFYREAGGQEPNIAGVLKFCDFAFTSFHGPKSAKYIDSPGVSRTYMAPERFTKPQVSQRYDIWSLGCVFSEYVTWYLQGGNGVDTFAEERCEGTSRVFKEDTFFSLEQNIDDGSTTATRKKAVEEHFFNLRNKDECSDLIWDLLSYIETHLLRMTSNRRHTIQNVVKFLASMLSKCQKNPDYATKPTTHPKPERASTHDSALRMPAARSVNVISSALSPEQVLVPTSPPLEQHEDGGFAPHSETSSPARSKGREVLVASSAGSTGDSSQNGLPDQFFNESNGDNGFSGHSDDDQAAAKTLIGSYHTQCLSLLDVPSPTTAPGSEDELTEDGLSENLEHDQNKPKVREQPNEEIMIPSQPTREHPETGCFSWVGRLLKEWRETMLHNLRR